MLRIAILATFLMIAGCATITQGTTQYISVDTPSAPGASCVLSSAGIATRKIVTPATLVVEKSQEHIRVRCSKECFEVSEAVIASNLEVMAAGNILVGGVIGVGVDAMSGAINKYDRDTSINMTPIPGCRARA